MIHHVFSIHDNKADAYFPPFYLHNIAMATRQFGDMVNDPTSTISKHPQDYTLFTLGTWDDSDAQFKQKINKQSLGNGVEFIYNEINDTKEDQIET